MFALGLKKCCFPYFLQKTENLKNWKNEKRTENSDKTTYACLALAMVA
jgi:hypothetical protein